MAAGEQQGRDYLQRHRIPSLLHRLGALVLYHRPERPREFLIQALEKVKAGRRAEGEYPNLMDEDNVVAMFGLLDAVGQGHITAAQYREGRKGCWRAGLCISFSLPCVLKKASCSILSWFGSSGELI
ncbi:EF-hand calcium-binding domain-containing protein 10 isoform 2-T2 [Amazona ochrocephala]